MTSSELFWRLPTIFTMASLTVRAAARTAGLALMWSCASPQALSLSNTVRAGPAGSWGMQKRRCPEAVVPALLGGADAGAASSCAQSHCHCMGGCISRHANCRLLHPLRVQGHSTGAGRKSC